MIRILITEDSEVVALLLKAIFQREADFEVIGHARNGREAVQMAHDLKPDLVTMDIRMPVMDGFDATRMIMSTNPVPIVVISSSVDDEELRITFRAIEEGALAVLEKPHGVGHPDFETIRRELVDTVRAMAEVKVVRRWNRPAAPSAAIFETEIGRRHKVYELVAVGSSTGGPQTLQAILSNLPVGFPLPILVVQHIAKGFIGGLVSWLKGTTLLQVKLAEDTGVLEPGTVYFAPDEHHLRAVRRNGRLVAEVRRGEPVDRHCPSVSELFDSVAACCGERGVGLLLTGMGEDGARGLLQMRQRGAHTVAQDEESCVVFGMPRAAIELGAVEKVAKLAEIPAHLTDLAKE